MCVIKGEMLFYGLDGINEKVDYIISDLKIDVYCFEIKLILVESISNAFIHGNNRNVSKPINLEYKLENGLVTIKVTDCGIGFKNVNIPMSLNEFDILSENGRGLYLINYYSDEVQFNNNTIIMKKEIN